jgi:hypothetical protein
MLWVEVFNGSVLKFGLTEYSNVISGPLGICALRPVYCSWPVC